MLPLLYNSLSHLAMTYDSIQCLQYRKKKLETVRLVAGRWVSVGTPVSPTYKTNSHDITEILFRVLAAYLEIADILKILKTHNCSSNGDLSLCQILCLYHYAVRSYQH
jgi:hypothetical protein